MAASTLALEIAEKYHNAWTTGDLDGAMDYVADDVVVHAPGDEITGKDAYREYLGGFMSILTGLTNLASYGDDNGAVLYYFPHTPFTQTAPAAEYFTVEQGKITESHLVFDRLSFGPRPEQDSAPRRGEGQCYRSWRTDRGRLRDGSTSAVGR